MYSTLVIYYLRNFSDLSSSPGSELKAQYTVVVPTEPKMCPINLRGQIPSGFPVDTEPNGKTSK